MPNRTKATGSKNSDERISVFMNEKCWVDRWAKELKGQQEYSQKWACLNDPKLYMGENAPESYSHKTLPTKWSAFSVINPPGRSPVLSKPEIPYGFIPPTFKITGERDSIRKKPTRVNAWDAAHPKTEYETSASSYGTAYKKKTPPALKKELSINKHSVSIKPAPEPVFHKAPFATDTPVSSEDIQRLEKNYRASLIMYNSSLVGARAGGKAEFARDPQTVYTYPATSSMQYGWNFKRKSLEIYGR